MELYDLSKSLHYAIGVIALGTFWSAALLRKGSPLHKRIGKIYLLAMVGIIFSAGLMTVVATLRDPGPRDAFLAYLLIITGTGCWLFWRAIEDKREFRRYTGPVYRVLAVINPLAGLSILVIGLLIHSILLAGFSAVGILLGLGMFRLLRSGPTHSLWWRQEHINAMLGNGIATHIAFLSIGLPKLLPMLAGPQLQMFAWFGPLMIALLLRIWLSRKYAPSTSHAALPAKA